MDCRDRLADSGDLAAYGSPDEITVIKDKLSEAEDWYAPRSTVSLDMCA